jgi:prepilin-type N-terminal cleavage/methylation domain-containing protein
MLSLRRMRRGFTLAEVLVAVALIAALAAVTVPTIRGRMQDAYEDSLISEFETMSSGIQAYKQDVGRYPARLDYLFVLPSGVNPSPTAPKDRCGNFLTATQIANWRGPYITRSLQSAAASFVVAGKDTMLTTFTTATGGFKMKIFGPDLQTAGDVDVKVDGTADQLNGTIQYSANGTDYGVEYLVPSKSGAC